MKHYHYDKITSTSEYAKEMISTLEIPCIISANEQTCGKGRKGNYYYSPPDTGLYFTYVSDYPNNITLITCGIAVAICKSLEKFDIDNCKIKWVNDIYINNKKVAGILSEAHYNNNYKVLSIGIGINITTKQFPSNLNNAGSLNVDLDKNKLIDSIVNEIIATFSLGDKYIQKEYSDRMFLIGKRIKYTKDNLIYEGTVKGLNMECNLIINNDNGDEISLSSGEISIIEF